MDLRARAKALKTEIPAVFLALRHRDTPWYAKALAALTVGYALSPIDLIPDFIPLLGYLDDVLLLPLLVAGVVRLLPPAVLAECRAQAETLWQGGWPKRWLFALPVLALWAIALAALAWWLMG